MITPAFLIATASIASAPVARVEFSTNRIGRTTVSGVADRRTSRRITPDDAVRVASVSKLVVALGVMRLVEAGKLDLDRDVSAYLGWSARNPDFPDVAITLRMLLSHTSGLRDDADYAIPLGDTLRARLGDRRAWDIKHHPGNWFRYSNLNFPFVASIMEAANGSTG